MHQQLENILERSGVGVAELTVNLLLKPNLLNIIPVQRCHKILCKN